jgi:hypothetical protein
MSDSGGEHIDWSLTTWEGARREQVRRWSALPIERIVSALEEMQDIAQKLASDTAQGPVGEKRVQGRAREDTA